MKIVQFLLLFSVSRAYHVTLLIMSCVICDLCFVVSFRVLTEIRDVHGCHSGWCKKQVVI